MRNPANKFALPVVDRAPCGPPPISVKGTSLWDLGCRGCCITIAVLGILTLWLASIDLNGQTKTQGQVLGGFLGVAGLLGSLTSVGWSSGCSGQDSIKLGTSDGARVQLRTLLLLALSVGVFSSVGLFDQINRDVGAHCVLAEAATRIQHLEESVTKLNHDELITQVFFRLNEMDDLLEMVSHRAAAVGEIQAGAHVAKMQDKDYIRVRLDRLKKHARGVAESLRAMLEGRSKESSQTDDGQAKTISQNPADGLAEEISPFLNPGQQKAVSPDPTPGQPQTLPPKRNQSEDGKELFILQKRIEAVDFLVQYLDNKGEDLTFEEYEIVLHALMGEDGGASSPGTTGKDPTGYKPSEQMVAQLKVEQKQLEATKATFERHKRDVYHKDTGSKQMDTVQRISQRKDMARKEFESRFMAAFSNQGSPLAPHIFNERLKQYLQDLPEYCLRDVAAYAYLRWVLLGAAALQLVAIYLAANAFVNLVRKKDD